MPNTREKQKLVELLDDALQSVAWHSCDYPYTDEAADRLIANGVTIATDNNKWIPVTERLPDDWVLCACVDKEVHILCYDYIMDDWDIWGRPNSCYSKPFVTHWMPLPQPPKGE